MGNAKIEIDIDRDPKLNRSLHRVTEEGYLEANGGSATLVDLSNNITLDLVKVWLGLLLGGLDISIEQTSDDFYSPEGILIV